MKLKRVNPYPQFFAICKHCGTRLDSAKQAIFTDATKKPLKFFYCEAYNEILRLKWSNVDIQRKLIHIDKTKSKE